MKKLSIEQKAKAYDEAIERAKDMLSYKEVRREDIEYLFPELKESEGERIRRQTLKVLNYYKDEEKSEGRMPTEIDECIAWLEKQGEKPQRIISAEAKEAMYDKPDWSDEDESLRLRTIGALETCKIGSPTKCVDEQINWLKSLKQRIKGE